MEFSVFDCAGWKCTPLCRQSACEGCESARRAYSEQLCQATQRGQVIVKVQPGPDDLRQRPLSMYLFSVDWPHLNIPEKKYVYRDQKHCYIDESFIQIVLGHRYRRNADDTFAFFDRIGVPRHVTLELDTQVREKLFGVVSVRPEQQGLVDEAMHFDFDVDDQVRRAGGPYPLLYPEAGFDFDRTAARKKINSSAVLLEIFRSISDSGRLAAGIKPRNAHERFDLIGGHLKFAELMRADGVYDCLRREAFEELGLTSNRDIDRDGRIVAEPLEVTSDPFEQQKLDEASPKSKMFIVYKRIPNSSDFFTILVSFIVRLHFCEIQLEVSRSERVDLLPDGLRIVPATAAATATATAVTEDSSDDAIASFGAMRVADLAELVTIKCKDCMNDFIFSESEREYYRSKGYDNPIRCKPCRENRKQAPGGRGSDGRGWTLGRGGRGGTGGRRGR